MLVKGKGLKMKKMRAERVDVKQQPPPPPPPQQQHTPANACAILRDTSTSQAIHVGVGAARRQKYLNPKP